MKEWLLANSPTIVQKDREAQTSIYQGNTKEKMSPQDDMKSGKRKRTS